MDSSLRLDAARQIADRASRRVFPVQPQGPDVLFAQARWGDYSFAQVDPSGLGIWLATEYIPPAANQDPIDNWETYAFEVNPFPFG